MSRSESLFYSKVFIILVNWNNYVDTISCLSSLFLIDYEDYCVIVIDNGIAFCEMFRTTFFGSKGAPKKQTLIKIGT